jgi:hypothetical protein
MAYFLITNNLLHAFENTAHEFFFEDHTNSKIQSILQA